MKPFWVALGLLLSLNRGSLFADGNNLTQIQQNLQHIEEQKQQAKHDISGQKQAERSLLKDLAHVDKKLSFARRDEKTYQHNIAVVTSRIQESSRRIAQCQLEIDLQREMMRKELVALYKAGPLGGMKLLLSSKDPSELISRYYYLRTLARHNGLRIVQTRDNMVKIDAYRAQSQQQATDLQANKDSAAKARREAAAEKRNRENLLGQVRRKRSRSQSLLKELDASAAQLQNLFTRLQGEAEAEAAAQRRRRQPHDVSGQLDEGPSKLGRPHHMLWPVRGRILSHFGQQQHPLFNTTVFNRGIEIGAPLGTVVSAVADGTVRYADYFDGYGQMVIVDHGGGYFTVYGNNSALSVKEGQQVQRGQAIAEVGDSLTLKRSALYFEVRSMAKAVDPGLWLAR